MTKIFGDYHMHTSASDGHGTVADKAARAKELGLSEIAVADHGTGSLFLHQTREKFLAQHAEIDSVNQKGGVRIYSSIEANITSEDGTLDVPSDIIARCDALHVGFHRFLQPRYLASSPRYLFVNGWGSLAAREQLREVNTRALLAVMERYPVDVLCHLCHRALVDVGRVCRAAAERGVYVELNEKHIGALAPYADDLVASGAMFVVGSDAHSDGKVGAFSQVTAFIEKYRIPEERVCGIGARPMFCPKYGFKSAE